MWYWNPQTNTEAISGLHDLTGCLEIADDSHPFKTQQLDGERSWRSDADGMPVCVKSSSLEENSDNQHVTI